MPNSDDHSIDENQNGHNDPSSQQLSAVEAAAHCKRSNSSMDSVGMVAKHSSKQSYLGRNTEARRYISSTRGDCNSYRGDPPRSLAELRTITNIISVGDRVSCRDVAEIRTAERFEVSRKLPVVNGRGLCKRYERLSVGCSCRQVDCGKTVWTFSLARSEENPWICIELRSFKCLLETEASRVHGSTAYSIDMLRPLIAQHIMNTWKMTISTVGTILADYCARKLSSSFLRRIVDAVKKDIVGDPSEEVKKLPCVIYALQEKGWTASLYSLNASQMKTELLIIAKQDHEYMQRNLAEGDRSPFNPSAVPELDDHFEYVVGFSLSPPYVANLYSNCHSYSSSDFVICDGTEYAGILGSRYAMNPNRGLVDLAHVRLLFNEGERSWDVLNYATMMAVPTLDNKDHVDVSHRANGSITSFETHFKSAHSFYDYKRRVEAIGNSAVGKRGVWAYKKACTSKSFAELQSAKDEMDDDVRRYLNKVPDHQQYPVSATGLRGNLGKNMGESDENALLNVKEAPFTRSLLLLASNIQQRWQSQRENALECKGILPPRIDTRMRAQNARAPLFRSNLVSISPCKTNASVQSVRYPGKVYRVQYDAIRNADSNACDGLCSIPTGVPCEHQIAAATHLGKHISTFMNVKDRADTWQNMYDSLVIEIPSTAEIESFIHMKKDNLRLPPSLPRKRGRPRNMNRSMGPTEKRSYKKRKMTLNPRK